MRKYYLHLICVFMALIMGTITFDALAQTPRILLVGDSWTDVPDSWGSFDSALVNRGLGTYETFPGVGSHSENRTALGGSTAEQWATNQTLWGGAPVLDRIPVALAAEPTIDIVHVSIGGNDFLGQYAPELTDAENLAIFEGIIDDIEILVTYILSLDPDITVGLASYDVLNRGKEVADEAELNRQLVIFEGLKLELANSIDRCVYLNCMGLLQHVYGASGETGPGELPAPGTPPLYDPFPGGDPSLPTALSYLNDPIHLTDPGYVTFFDECIEQLYGGLLVGAPRVESVTANNSGPVSAPYTQFTVVFSEPVTGVSIDDFVLVKGDGIEAAYIASISGSGDTYTVNVYTGAGEGDLQVYVVDDDSIVDGSSNPLGGTGDNGGYISGTSASIARGELLPMAAWPLVLVLLLVGMTLLCGRSRARHATKA